MTTFQKNLVFHDHLKNDLVFRDHLNNNLVFHDQMLDFITGDDFANIIPDNIDADIDYILNCPNSPKIVSLEVASSAVVSEFISPQVAKVKKRKRKRVRKGGWFCASCKSTFSSKQSLVEHMENIRMCQKKQKRLEEEPITLAPHENLGETLQLCIDTLQKHERMNAPEKAK